ncbi:hypothetical protein ACJIZ3_009687 [Penstemon smallii]|uniref:VQ domain-containing protein n=1 Tax=Penstemon smallii TaxID=265156 RepID=A0ABD3TD89_9LAMI
MDNSNRQMDHLGVNKMGKNIKKSPLHQPNFASAAANAAPRQQPQPQVYNINKNDFRNIVQQLTGSPSREPQPRPPQNNPKPPNHRLQRVRPPPLAPTNRPQVPIHPYYPVQGPPHGQPPASLPYPNQFSRPPPPPQYDQPLLPSTPNDLWANTTESPVSAYMRYLQNSIIDSQPQPHFQHQFHGHNQAQPRLLSPRVNGPPPTLPSPRMNGPPPLLASPRMNGPPPLLASPRMSGPPPGLPSPRMNGPPPPLLPSPTSQFFLPSPTGFLNILSPRSPYPLLSPGYHHPPPISPNFSFSSVGQSGILGPGPHPPPSPGYGFPLSPSGFFPISSPRWRD